MLLFPHQCCLAPAPSGVVAVCHLSVVYLLTLLIVCVISVFVSCVCADLRFWFPAFYNSRGCVLTDPESPINYSTDARAARPSLIGTPLETSSPTAAPPTYTRTGTRGVEETDLIINDLRSNGYSVVGGVLSSEECQEAIDGMWDWLASLGSGITKYSPDTWGNNRWATLINSWLFKDRSRFG